MKAIVNENSKLTDIIGIEYELGLSVHQYLDGTGLKQELAGHWRIDHKAGTIALIRLTPMQVTELDVMMVKRLKLVTDLVALLDSSLEIMVRDSN